MQHGSAVIALDEEIGVVAEPQMPKFVARALLRLFAGQLPRGFLLMPAIDDTDRNFHEVFELVLSILHQAMFYFGKTKPGHNGNCQQQQRHEQH
jgi:hypothetical protein